MADVVTQRDARPFLFPLALALAAVALALPARVHAALDDFHCYSVHLKPRGVADISLVNALDNRTLTIVRPHRYCTPANIDGADPTAPSHPVRLEGWRIINSRFNRKQEKTVQVTNKFGSFAVRVMQPNYFYAPTASSWAGIPAPLPGPPTVDHFMCYQAKMRNKKMFPFFVNIENEFRALSTKLVGPMRVCLASNVNGSGIVDPTAALMCFVARPNHFPVGFPVYSNNEFDSGYLPLFRSPEVCIPSHLDLPSPSPSATVTPLSTATPTPTQTPDPTPTETP